MPWYVFAADSKLRTILKTKFFSSKAEALDWAKNDANFGQTVYMKAKNSAGSYTSKGATRIPNSGRSEGFLSSIKRIIPVHALIETKDGKIHAIREKNPGRRANVAMGFKDANGVFHPLRASEDYSAKRAGEAKKRKPKRAMPTSRREYGGDGSRYRNAGRAKGYTLDGSHHSYATMAGALKAAKAKAKVTERDVHIYSKSKGEFIKTVKLRNGKISVTAF